MRYTSSRTGREIELPKKLVDDVRDYLERSWIDPLSISKGQLQDRLLQYRYEGKRLLVNQMAPIFLEFCLRWELQ